MIHPRLLVAVVLFGLHRLLEIVLTLGLLVWVGAGLVAVWIDPRCGRRMLDGGQHLFALRKENIVQMITTLLLIVVSHARGRRSTGGLGRALPEVRLLRERMHELGWPRQIVG